MKSSNVLTALVLMGLAGVPVTGASAELIQQNSAKAEAAFDKCEDGGSATIERNGIKSCFQRDGHGIICGGPKPEHQGTCDTFRRSPKKPKRLTGVEMARMKKPAKALH